MDDPMHMIEYETMLLGRYFIMTARAKGDEGFLDSCSYVVLSRLQVSGPMSIRQLSESFGLDLSTLNRRTHALVGAGLAERIPDPDGGIARKFRITAEGSRRLDRDRAETVSGLTRVLRDWSEGDVSEFAGYLRRFNASIETVSDRPWPRPS